MNTQNLPTSTLLGILDTYEGMIRQGGASLAVYARWTEIKTELALRGAL